MPKGFPSSFGKPHSNVLLLWVASYLIKRVIDDRRQIRVGYLRKHLSDGTANEFLRFMATEYWLSVKGASRPVVGDTALEVVLSVGGSASQLFEPTFVGELVSKFAAG